ncbi:MAG: SusC/RagA family TonB-linked outer membrane protein [Mucilaginibacter sp.]
MKKNLLVILLLTFVFARLSAQTRQVAGQVSEKGSGQTIPAATVILKGSTLGVQTDADGNFKIGIPAGNVTLIFRCVGYKTREVAVPPGQSNLKVELEATSQTLNEVVAIGYQSVRRSNLPGAVASISSKDLKDEPVNSLADALEGRLAGVQVQVSEGAPGASASIFIRGRNSITQSGSPLFIVDGVQVDNALNVIAPQDIATIDVLKDAASTAIYGSRGSNGVIIITTKGGKNTNGKITVAYSSSVSLQKLERELPMMSLPDYLSFQYERYRLTGDSSFIDNFTRVGSNFDTLKTYNNVKGTDWQKTMFGRNAFAQNHNLSLTGGTERSQFNLSVTDNAQQGLLLGSDYNRQVLNFRFNQKIADNVQASINFRYNQQVVDGSGTSDVGGSGNNNLRNIVRYPPYIPGQDVATGAYDPSLDAATNGNGLRLVNPLDLLPELYRKNKDRVLDMNANVAWDVTKNITIRSVIGYDIDNSEQRAFNDTLTADAQSNLVLPTATLITGQVMTIDNSNTIDYHNPAFINNKSSFDILVGQEFYQTDTRAQSVYLRYFPVGLTPDQAFANLSLAQAPAGYTEPSPTSSEVPVHTLSYFSRANFTFNGKYILSASIRADGSSIFAPGHQWGYFPAVSGAWRVSDESFMKNQTIFSELKLRATYGTSGNNRITPYSYATAYSVGKSYYLNNAAALGLAPGSVLNNPDLQWEVLKSKNIGLDMAFLKGRLQASIDAYDNVTSKLLINNAIPTNTGYTNQFQNVGSTGNKGIELVVSATVMQKKNFSWNATFNISSNKNVILSLGQQQQFQANSGWFSSSNAPADYLVKVGQEVGTMYGLKNDGYYKLSDFTATPYSNSNYPWATYQYTLKAGVPTSSIIGTVMPGSPKFVDENHDGKVDQKDFTVIGHALPRAIGGLFQTFHYKNFDASIFLNYSLGGNVYNDNKLEFTSTYSTGANLLSIMDNRWRVMNPATGAPLEYISGTTVIGAAPSAIAAVNGNPKYWVPVTGVQYTNPQSFAVENASFLRLNNLTLGYTFSKILLGTLHITNLRVYATGNNLWTITGYSGYDPDVSVRNNTPLTPGVDYSAYPRARSYFLGLNVSF